ncbi:hypothetical protein [Streptomyces sp. NPDC051286]|uniref:hypothetical protein n=1 Tax=Streptomyces sp. NPDC051286 TaxID=3365647 RepID=UPI00379C1E0B
MPEQKEPRRFLSHAHCNHPATKVARRECRMALRHADCDHGPTQHERIWCTRRKNKAAEAE